MGPGAACEGNDDPRQASTGPPHHQGMWTQMQLTGHSQFCFVLFFLVSLVRQDHLMTILLYSSDKSLLA